MDFLRAEVFPDHVPDSNGVWPAVLEMLETLLLSVVLFWGINFLTARIRVESISMLPNLHEGDFVIVYKLAFKSDLPDRGDVVVFYYPPDPDGEPPYIKRVIGLPGDRVRIEGGKVYINDQIWDEPYLTTVTNRGGTWLVPEQSIFVMGDNRNNSSDSRSWGMVPMDQVIGKAIFVYWPFDHWGALHLPEAVAAVVAP